MMNVRLNPSLICYLAGLYTRIDSDMFQSSVHNIISKIVEKLNFCLQTMTRCLTTLNFEQGVHLIQ